MLNIFSQALTTASRHTSTLAPMGDYEARKLYMEQSRLERRAAQAKALTKAK